MFNSVDTHKMLFTSLFYLYYFYTFLFWPWFQILLWPCKDWTDEYQRRQWNSPVKLLFVKKWNRRSTKYLYTCQKILWMRTIESLISLFLTVAQLLILWLYHPRVGSNFLKENIPLRGWFPQRGQFLYTEFLRPL